MVICKQWAMSLSLLLALAITTACNPATPFPTPGTPGRLIVVTSTPRPADPGAATPTPVTARSTPAVSAGDTLASPATPTGTPTPLPAPVVATCADIDAYWGQNWPALLDSLARLIEAGQRCGEEPLPAKKYAAHFIYGASLEEQGQTEAAIEQYQAALFIDPQRREALEALFRLDALPPPTPPACLSDSPPLPDPAVSAAPDPGQLVITAGDQLRLGGRSFTARGVNYYPRHAPWARFLSEANPAEMARELNLIRQAGFNTIRIFLWYQPLFTCQPEDAIPNEAAFGRLDTLLQLAGERDLKVIVTLNDLADLTFRPLYTDWDHYDAQTTYIVRRYRHNPTILAWDLRNEGDLDYGADGDPEARFTEAEVTGWLAHVSQLVRANDPYHLLTAGWWGDPTTVSPYVDILSFHHWTDGAELQARIEAYRRRSDKPLLLQEIGYHSWAEAPDEPRTEAEQADRLLEVLQVAEAEQLAGWLIWTAFDFAPPPGQPPVNEFYFGLWRVDLTPKPVLDRLRR